MPDSIAAPQVASQFVGDKARARGLVPLRHRVRLIDGTVVEGNIYRPMKSRLADYLVAQKEFVSLTEVSLGVVTEEPIAHLAINKTHILYIEELESPGQ